jgi:hypothetical protein
MTPGRTPQQPRRCLATTPTLDFGRYAGWKISDVARVDPVHLRWLGRHATGSRLRYDDRAHRPADIESRRRAPGCDSGARDPSPQASLCFGSARPFHVRVRERQSSSRLVPSETSAAWTSPTPRAWNLYSTTSGSRRSSRGWSARRRRCRTSRLRARSGSSLRPHPPGLALQILLSVGQPDVRARPAG